jgi:hypothetical protein
MDKTRPWPKTKKKKNGFNSASDLERDLAFNDRSRLAFKKYHFFFKPISSQ